jgi:hypothetical protein
MPTIEIVTHVAKSALYGREGGRPIPPGSKRPSRSRVATDNLAVKARTSDARTPLSPDGLAHQAAARAPRLCRGFSETRQRIKTRPDKQSELNYKDEQQLSITSLTP